MDVPRLLSETLAMLDRVDKVNQRDLYAALRLEYLRLSRLRTQQQQLDDRPTVRIWSDAG